MPVEPLNEISKLYRQQIDNITIRMCEILDQTASASQIRNVKFDGAEAHFKETEKRAYRSCSALDGARSIANETKAIAAIDTLITMLITIRNETEKLARDSRVKGSELLMRFQSQFDKVEHLMNAAMRPLLNSSLSEKGNRQALETLERWAELYRNGLRASGNIPAHGEKWLSEAHKRLDLTVHALRQLDVKNEAASTRNREHENAG